MTHIYLYIYIFSLRLHGALRVKFGMKWIINIASTIPNIETVRIFEDMPYKYNTGKIFTS
jgi:hypothetical protein